MTLFFRKTQILSGISWMTLIPWECITIPPFPNATKKYHETQVTVSFFFKGLIDADFFILFRGWILSAKQISEGLKNLRGCYNRHVFLSSSATAMSCGGATCCCVCRRLLGLKFLRCGVQQLQPSQCCHLQKPYPPKTKE